MFCQYVFPGSRTHNLCATNTKLYHWAQEHVWGFMLLVKILLCDTKMLMWTVNFSVMLQTDSRGTVRHFKHRLQLKSIASSNLERTNYPSEESWRHLTVKVQPARSFFFLALFVSLFPFFSLFFGHIWWPVIICDHCTGCGGKGRVITQPPEQKTRAAVWHPAMPPLVAQMHSMINITTHTHTHTHTHWPSPLVSLQVAQIC